MTEFADAIRDASQGRAGRDALVAGAQAMRIYVREHPGRYAVGNAARPAGRSVGRSQQRDRSCRPPRVVSPITASEAGNPGRKGIPMAVVIHGR